MCKLAHAGDEGETNFPLAFYNVGIAQKLPSHRIENIVQNRFVVLIDQHHDLSIHRTGDILKGIL